MKIGSYFDVYGIKVSEPKTVNENAINFLPLDENTKNKLSLIDSLYNIHFSNVLGCPKDNNL